MRRGDIVQLLHASVRDDVDLLLSDSIVALEQFDRGVEATFSSGPRRTFDLVVGADGMHSATRDKVFGPENRFHRYLGHCFAFFTTPNRLGLSREIMMWNAPGRAAVLYATGDDELHASLSFYRPEGLTDAHRSRASQRDLVATAFDGAGWEVPSMVQAM